MTDDTTLDLEPRYRLKERIDALTEQIKALKPPKVKESQGPDRYLKSLLKALTRAEKAAAKLVGQMPKRKKKRARRAK